MQQQVIAEQVKVLQIEKEQQVKVQEAEILRHEKELIATVLKGSEIEAQRIQNIAAAEKGRMTIEAEGRAAAARAQGEAQAAITRLQGEAEADIIFSKGEAEAKAMNVKAEAYQEWSQAAVVDKLITNMADVVRAMAEPLTKVDKITIVSTGGDQQTGASKITGDMTKIAAQVPALFEALSGMKMSDLMANVKAMKPREDERAERRARRRRRNHARGSPSVTKPVANRYPAVSTLERRRRETSMLLALILLIILVAAVIRMVAAPFRFGHRYRRFYGYDPVLQPLPLRLPPASPVAGRNSSHPGAGCARSHLQSPLSGSTSEERKTPSWHCSNVFPLCFAPTSTTFSARPKTRKNSHANLCSTWRTS